MGFPWAFQPRGSRPFGRLSTTWCCKNFSRATTVWPSLGSKFGVPMADIPTCLVAKRNLCISRDVRELRYFFSTCIMGLFLHAHVWGWPLLVPDVEFGDVRNDLSRRLGETRGPRLQELVPLASFYELWYHESLPPTLPPTLPPISPRSIKKNTSFFTFFEDSFWLSDLHGPLGPLQRPERVTLAWLATEVVWYLPGWSNLAGFFLHATYESYDMCSSHPCVDQARFGVHPFKKQKHAVLAGDIYIERI